MSDGTKSALAEAVEAHRDAETKTSQQGDLFALSARRTELDQAIDAARADAIVEQAQFEAAEERRQAEQPRGRGRPPGARNIRTEEAARFYVRRHGDPLEQAIKLGAIPILAAGVLEALARRLGSTRLEAAKWWASNNQAVMGFIHAKHASIEVKPVGSPGSSEAATWEGWSYTIEDGQFVDASVEPQHAQQIADQRVPDAVPDQSDRKNPT